MAIDLYQGVTDQIIAMLDKGVVPWRSPILSKASAGHLRNLITEKPYRGVNVFLLAFTAWTKGYGSSCWLTFNQAKSLGGNIKKGEKPATVIFWKQLETIDTDTQKPTTIPLLRYFNVFNVEQCEGITPPDVPPVDSSAFVPSEAAEKIVRGYVDGPTVDHGGFQAYYSPLFDSVKLPEPARLVGFVEHYQNGDYLRKLSRDTMRGMVARAQRGLWPTGMIPFGYDRLCLGSDGSPKRIIRDMPNRSQLVLHPETREVLEHVRDGHRYQKPEHEAVTLVPSEQSRVEAVQKLFADYLAGVPFRLLRDNINATGMHTVFGGIFTIQTATTLGLYAKAKALAGERQRVESQLQALQSKLPELPESSEIARRADEELSHLDELIASGSLEEQRELIRHYVKGAKTHPAKQEIELSFLPALFSRIATGGLP